MSDGSTWSAEANTVRPTKSVARMPAIQASVIAAFRDSGARKAGIPLEIASVPVMAVHPDEKARSTRNHVRASIAAGGGSVTGSSVPVTIR